MKITHQNSDALNAVITVELAPEDYNPAVDKAIKEQAKKAKLPGFRPGLVPTSHIRRTYGKAILFDEVNRLVNDKISEYIAEQKLEVLGQPLPKEDDEANYNWDFKDTFSLNYEIGLAPEFETPFTAKSKFTQYVIKADEKTLEERMKNLRRSYGKMTNPEVSEDGDVLYAEFTQIGDDNLALEGGLQKLATLRLDLVEDKKIKKSLIGLKKDSEVTIDLAKALKADAISRIFGITEEEANALQPTQFKVVVKNINRLEEADLNEDFYTKLFGEGEVKTEEEFKNKVKEEVEALLVQNAEQKLQNDMYLEGMEKVNVEFPTAFLKRWLKATNPSISEEELEAGFEDFVKNLKWTLIENQIVRNNNLEIKYEEVLNLAKNRILVQLRMYGQMEPDDKELTQYAIQLLQDQEQANRLFEETKALKVFDFLKTLVKIDNKEIEYNKFLELK
jgi:trigger factor